ncbi:MAG: O-antigen ligase family protein [Rhodospirillum sp.]|nr:O-antigen ligase family protein [Rhodospirillum sp.]MCF8488109.1 O-antigen ligase family protein [Rhodospirillum sp.]MCF8501282.1 O-antigen ligase family protein [Rhodospirillum sp.]
MGTAWQGNGLGRGETEREFAPRRRGIGRVDPLRLLADATLVLGLAYTICGAMPFSGGLGGDQSQGNALLRLIPISLFAMAVPLLIVRWPLVRVMLTRNWVMVVTLGWLVLSIGWSDLPGLSVRRVGFLIVGYLTALGVAAWADDIERTTKIMAALLTIVVLIDLASVPLVPHLAMSDEGARGMHSQKNQAGAVCLLAIIALSFCLPSMRRLFGVAMVVGPMVLTVVFLVLTRSKTSMALVGLYMVFLLPLCAGLAWERGKGVVLVLFAGVVVSLFVLTIGVEGWTLPDVLTLIFGDPTFTGRTDIWDFAFDQIAQRPVFGTGYGAFWDAGEAHDYLRHANNWLRFTPVGVINQTHNGYIDLWVQAGLPAMVGGVMVMVRPLVLAGLGLARDSWGRAQWIGYAQLFCLMMLFLVYNLMESAVLSRVHFFGYIIFLYALFAERWTMPDIALSRRAPSPGWGETG